MTAWLDFWSEPMTEVPEIEEFIGIEGWTLTCQAVNCNWTAYGERTESFMEEMQEDIESHRRWHEDGMPK